MPEWYRSSGDCITLTLHVQPGAKQTTIAGLHGDGGPTASRFLMQFTADIARTELRVATMSDGSPLGATLAGQLGLGFRASMDALAGVPREETTYRPILPAKTANALYASWQVAVRRVLNG